MWREVVAGAAGAGLVLGTLGLGVSLMLLRSRRRPLRQRGHRAWLLVVRLKFSDGDAAREFLSDLEQCAAGVRQHEQGALGYEVAQSDKDPLLFQVFERYASKVAYFREHRAHEHFKLFRKKLQSLEEAGRATVSGESFDECGLGFMQRDHAE